MKKILDDIGLVRQWFESRGVKILTTKHKSANGPDMVAVTNSDAIRIEIKKLSPGTRCWKAKPVEITRRKDDLVAVVFPCGYVFVEAMDDYLKCCSPSGYRFFTSLVFDASLGPKKKTLRKRGKRK